MTEQHQLSLPSFTSYQPKDYHQTTPLDEPTLERTRAKARGLQAEILTFFEEHRGHFFTPHEVHEAMCQRTGRKLIITSIRRAMTNLEQAINNGVVKLEEMKDERYGSPNHKWGLNVDSG